MLLDVVAAAVDFVPVAPLVVAISDSPVPTIRLGHPTYLVDPSIDLLSVGTVHIATAAWFEAPLPWFDTRGPTWVTNLGDWGANRPLARTQFPKTALANNWEEGILPTLYYFCRPKIYLFGQRGSVSKCRRVASFDVGVKNATAPKRPLTTFVSKTFHVQLSPFPIFQQWLVLPRLWR